MLEANRKPQTPARRPQESALGEWLPKQEGLWINLEKAS
jgi:hypothetical protein